MRKKVIDTTLTKRQTSILFALIKEYCDTGSMIGSKEVQEKYNFNFSSATIRNEISVLRDKGYLFQPFTNSASKPTEQSYKLFVSQLLNGLQVTNKKQKELELQLENMQLQQKKLSKEIAKLVALNSGGIGFAVSDDDETYSGTSNLFNKNNDQDNRDLSHVLDFLDNLEENKRYLLDSGKKLPAKFIDSDGEIEAYFDGDNPILSLGGGYAMVASEVEIYGGQKTVIGLITPVHMLTKKKSLETIKAIKQALNKKDSEKW
jgi:transcriptional regulator of heat shock response